MAQQTIVWSQKAQRKKSIDKIKDIAIKSLCCLCVSLGVAL
jgi:hypothetical protein